MLLIDQIASSKSSGGSHQSLSVIDPESGSSPKTSPRKTRTQSSSHSHGGGTWTTTLGLLVHAAADGIAMGKIMYLIPYVPLTRTAYGENPQWVKSTYIFMFELLRSLRFIIGSAAATHQVDVEFIVFLAIMLHKAPAAFGLVTFLMHEGVDRTKIRKHLITFSFAAPTMALTTYILLVMNSAGDTDLQGKVNSKSFNSLKIYANFNLTFFLCSYTSFSFIPC